MKGCVLPTLADPYDVLEDLDLYSIGQVNDLPGARRQQAYRSLVPLDITLRFGINPDTLTDEDGAPLFLIRVGPSSVELSLKHTASAEDPLLYLQLADTASNQIEVVLFVVNDPDGERFDTDHLPDGTPTEFGTAARNTAEELRAMGAGLAPGQVRRGLRLTRDVMPILERFIDALHHDAFTIQPLAYHNAILFERLGFSYMMGLGRMEWIHKGFSAKGLLHARLDGSTPFRRPGADQTVRGRSWAIHDGLLGMTYSGIKMYKRVGIHAGIVTFPGAAW